MEPLLTKSDDYPEMVYETRKEFENLKLVISSVSVGLEEITDFCNGEIFTGLFC